MFQKTVCMILSVALLLGALGITSYAGKLKDDDGIIPSLSEMQAVAGVVPYASYLANYANSDVGSNLVEIVLSASDIIEGNYEIVADSDKCVDYADEETWPGFGNNGSAVYLPASGSTTWQVKIDEDKVGFYYIVFEYYSCNTAESSTTNIERKLLIDGKVPFSEVSTITFNKHWKYDNIVVSDPVAAGPDDVEGTTTRYEHIEKEKDGKPGYYKIVTTVENGMKTVTTYTLSQDINGNSMSPGMASEPMWGTYYCSDATGYYDGYFGFYMAEGTRKITLAAEREPVVIKSVKLVPADSIDTTVSAPSYEDVLADYAANSATSANGGEIVKIEAEFPDMVSDTSVTPTGDKTSAGTYPYSSKASLFNVIGKQSYNTVGQWAAYKFTVTETGLYKLGMRYKQDALQGMYACRTLKLSGHASGAQVGDLGYYGLADGTATVPFAEAYDIRFNYDKDWQSTYLGNGEVEAFEFYFVEGVEYTMYLECSLGSLKEYIKAAEDALNAANNAYLQIIQLTGPAPDEFRDYKFNTIMPEVLVSLLTQAKSLMAIKEGLQNLCGTNGAHIATLETVALCLDETGSDEGFNIASNLSTLKSYLGTLGTWVNDSKKSTLVVDSIQVIPSDSDDSSLTRAKPNFFVSLWAEISSFFYSFFTDYDQMGLTVIPDEGATSIDVWLATGRDQSSIWRSMVDAKNGFTGNTGIAVKLKLVAAGTLLPSILSGKGPDVYMQLDSATVINYAIRDAIIATGGLDTDPIFNTTYYTYMNADGTFYDSTELVDGATPTFISRPYDQVTGKYNNDPDDPATLEDDIFVDAAMDTITLLGKSYGVPMTMTFAMMFYRMDVLADVGATLPETWDDMLGMLPQLQANNMEIGVAYISALDFMIYQLGGSMWKYTDSSIYDVADAGAKIGLDENVALQAFDFTCKLYTQHSFPVAYDPANRFRTGEMPILIGDYIGLYNQLVVFATEIEGLWGFCSLPGSVRADGTYNYDSLAGVTSTVILHGCDDLLSAWKFAQWQTSADVQARYGNGMVAIIGPSAKYEAANLDAIDNLSWSASEKLAIYDQIDNMSSIVNYPGSYIITRYTKFAFLDAVNDKIEPVTAIREYIAAINEELSRKRQEFGLPTYGADEEPEKKPQSAQ